MPECMLRRQQGYGGSVMVWGGFSLNHKLSLTIVDGNLNTVRYRDEILDQIVEPNFQAIAQERPIY